MTLGLVATPTVDADIDVIVDWLEFTAFFSQFGTARIDDISGSNRTQENSPDADFGDTDRRDDTMRQAIEAEVDARRVSLRDAYPFDLNRHGDELRLQAALDDTRASFYLLCLVASHVTRSSILKALPSDDLVRRMRNRVFQILGTLAVAGLVAGPAVSVGYPRETKEAILDVLRRAEEWGVGLTPRDRPGRHAVPQAKDGGIDVIGWPYVDRPPPPHIYFGQLASGHNWRDKPAQNEYANFMDDFFDEHGGAQHNFVTIIPFRIRDSNIFHRESKKHRSIFDRHRGPMLALSAIELPARGIPLDEVDNIRQIVEWLGDYRAEALASLAIA